MNNKGNLNPIGNLFYYVTAGDIIHYLENDILGFRVAADFTRWTGISAAHSYVRMRVIMQAKDIIVENDTTTDDYARKILQQNSVGFKLDENVTEALKPYQYPEKFNYTQMSPDAIRHLNELGVIGSKIEEICKNSKLTFVADPSTGKQYFRIYLRPERIIHDMLANPKTNKVDGEVYIRRVTGENSAEFKWLVEQVVNNVNAVSSDLNIDQIFAMKA